LRRWTATLRYARGVEIWWLRDLKIYDFLLGAFWVVVTLFALLFWGTIAYLAWNLIVRAW
jgi:hypothetical protein